jgi:hypothetical protein
MAGSEGVPMGKSDAIKTYRYLRLGMVAMVSLLSVSVLIERTKVDCWQTSISAYYYTPVRAVFVGALVAIGLGLVVIKGSTWPEDTALNVAGVLAPVVAFAPTSDAGRCWSVQPIPPPIQADGSLAPWVVDNIDNNILALLITGVGGLVLAAIVAMVATRNAMAPAEVGEKGTRVSLAVAFVGLVAGWLLFEHWTAFDTRAHGIAAVAMFACLAFAAAANAWQLRSTGPPRSPYFWIYSAIAVGMVATGGLLLVDAQTWDHRVLVIEVVEIVLFAVFWLVQTKEHWWETT